MVARFYQHQGRVLGLIDGAMADAHKVAESIWSRRELRNLVSRKTISELLLEHIGLIARQKPTSSLSNKIVDFVTKGVEPVSVWVPIDELLVDGSFPFATAVLAPISRAELDALVTSRAAKAPIEHVEQMRDDLYSKWAGRTVMRFELLAEPTRAEEFALERAADYMALLQFYTAPTMVLPLTSHIAPRSARPYRIQECIVSGPEHFHRTQTVTEPMYKLLITKEERSNMEANGLWSCRASRRTPHAITRNSLLVVYSYTAVPAIS